MGQKITEHPAVDKWVELMREKDKAIHKHHGQDPTAVYNRPAKDAREWAQYQEMERARTRVVTTFGHFPTCGPLALIPHLTYCLQCSTLIGDVSAPGVFWKRTTYPPDGEPVRSYLCPACAGWTGEA